MTHPLTCIGHRGASGYRPENTLSAFALAREMGCPWIELDVYAVENELLVIHDDELDRTTNGTGQLSDYSLAALRKLDAGDGQQIPTLAEVANLLERSVNINIELKGPDTAGPVSRCLDELCAAGWQPDQFLVSSFRHGELKRTDLAYARGALFHKAADYIAMARAADASAINLALKLVSPDVVEAAHAAGLIVNVYTVNEPDDIQYMRDCGVDGVFCDYPDRVLAGNPT